MATKQISRYIKDIQSKLFPSLKNALNINMSNNPISQSSTLAKFSGSLEDNRVVMEFSSNHVDLQGTEKEPTLFLYLYYGTRGTKAGVINLNDINEAIDLISVALGLLGYKSQQAVEKEKQEREQKEKAEREKEQARLQQRRKEIEDEIANQENSEEDNSEDLEYQKEVEQSINEVNTDFDRYKLELNKINEGIISVNITVPSNTTSKVINIDCNYVDENNCYIQTNGISPKIEKQVSWDKAKNYIVKVIEKLNATSSIFATDKNGNVLELESEETDTEGNANDINLDFDI